MNEVTDPYEYESKYDKINRRNQELFDDVDAKTPSDHLREVLQENCEQEFKNNNPKIVLLNSEIQALKAKIEELENLWRSVEDELPEKSGRYICCDEPYSSSVGESIVGYYENGKFYTEIAEDWTNTTHWMPLPKPPSQKGE